MVSEISLGWVCPQGWTNDFEKLFAPLLFTCLIHGPVGETPAECGLLTRREAGRCGIPVAMSQSLSTPAPYPEFSVNSDIPI